MADAMVVVRGLRKEFITRGAKGRANVVAVDDVDFEIGAGETFGLVGESGSGKSTIARLLLKVETPDGGQVLVDGKDIFRQSRVEEAAYRRVVQAVLQDPYDALSPRMTCGDIIGEPLRARGAARDERLEAIPRLLDLVGLPSAAAARYPHEFSGGQRQRIAIARALSVNPRLLVLDEPVSALDVSVRAQVMLLLRELQGRLGLTYMFVGHDLALVRYISTTVGVIYFGRMVEIGDANVVLRKPLHPYTRRLLAVASSQHRLGAPRPADDLPNPVDPPRGCHFRVRCERASDICATLVPALVERDANHKVACHNPDPGLSGA